MAAPRVDIDAPIDPVPFGKYLLLERVAQGRLASVHRALLRSDGEPDLSLAIKRFAPELSQDRRFAERATRVLERAAQIEHPAHCGVAEIASAEGTLYAALEWVSGKDLKRVVVAMRDRGETMPAALIAYLGSQVAEVLATAHGLTRAGKRAPLLHGELSPADILIGHDGRVCLTGLGSAELAVAARVPAVRPVFHAPEIGLGAACSEQSDVFSLGACLYQVLSLRLRDASSANARADSYITQIIPPALKQIVNRALAEDPTQRWPSAAELAHELHRWGSAQTQPGDARQMAAFMRELFGIARDEEEEHEEEHVPLRLAASGSSRGAREPQREGGWDAAEHTPPRGELMQALAEDMVDAATPKPPEAPSPGAQAIVDAIVNPDPGLDAESWSDNPWEEETPANPWISSAEERAASEKPRPRAVNEDSASLPAPSPRDLPAQRVHPQPQPLPVAPASARNAAPAAPSSPPVLASWQTERRSPWLVVCLAAVAALGLLLGGLFMLRSPAPQPSRATAPVPVPVVQHGAANAAPVVARPEAHAHEPEPVQEASAPSDTVVATHVASNRSSADARRARGNTSRDDSRDDSPARPKAAEVSDDLEPAAAPVESERRTAAPPALPPPYTARAQSPAGAAPVTVAPRPLPAPAPAASSLSVSRGPTRAATLITQVPPGFPARAKRQGIDAGVVTVEYTIDRSGTVKDAVVVKADPPRLFDDAVLDAIRQWKYQPKLVNGVPVDSRQKFTFHFE